MNKHYNYDLDQINWLINNGCRDLLLFVGVNEVTKTPYGCFLVSKKYKFAQEYYNKAIQSIGNQ